MKKSAHQISTHFPRQTKRQRSNLMLSWNGRPVNWAYKENGNFKNWAYKENGNFKYKDSFPALPMSWDYVMFVNSVISIVMLKRQN